MGKKQFSVTVQGTHKRWVFDVLADPRHVAEWRADGLVIDEVEDVIPAWVVDVGLLRPWVVLQDVFHFRNPWR